MTLRATILLAMLTVVIAGEAYAAAPQRFDIPAGRLSSALTILARQAGIELLFSHPVVGGHTAPAVQGQSTVEAALERLLAGSGLTFHRTDDGAIVIHPVAEFAAEASLAGDAIPEILVTGRRVQNVDIRRTEGDIQPYQVFTGRQMEDSHAGLLDNFMRTRFPANAQIISPAQNLQTGQGSTRSEINLRGLGANQTLLLVDGRRLPNIPQITISSLQPDINGIPVELVDRIEVLTATAGGIYGNGATSGALNVVLRHDYDGGEVALTTGLTTRGDAFEERVFGRFGFSPNDGRTGLMVAVGQSRTAALRYRDRDYLRRARERALANAPAVFTASRPTGNAINVFSRSALVLDTGRSLGATTTVLPLGFDGDVGRLDDLLVSNAGTLDLSPGGAEADATIVSQPSIRSIFLDARHEFGGGFAAFASLLDTRNVGRSNTASQSTAVRVLPAENALNPAQQNITVAAPLPGYDADVVNRIGTTRYTIGIVAPLAKGWTANLEYSGGGARSDYTSSTIAGNSDFYEAIAGRVVNGTAPPDPFGDWAAYLAAIDGYRQTSGFIIPRRSRFDDATLRVAGPVATLPGGRLTLTLLGEARREITSRSELTQISGETRLALAYPRLEQRVHSLYGEARLPVLGQAGLLTGLEFQLAVRQDWTRSEVPASTTLFRTTEARFVARSGSPAYTIGARVSPLSSLLVRASVATGYLPPATDQIGQTTDILSNLSDPDPQRGGRVLGSENAIRYLSLGSPDLLPEQARSWLIGVVLTPAGAGGPRLSIDYTQIRKRNEIVSFPEATVGGLIANEARYPGRVVRAPLTAADAALGFTGGPVTLLDFTLINIGRTRVDAVDLTIDCPFETPRWGRFLAYLKATWQPHYRQRIIAGAAPVERVGYSDGPLEWRGNAGVDWSSGAWSASANLQFYGGYRITNAVVDTSRNQQLLSYNGRARIPAQAYVDIAGRYRFGPAARIVPRGTEIRAGIVNLFDHRPPTIADLTSPGVSYYGDPRRRRVEVTVAVPLRGNR